jgi:hypothetical protein
MALKHTDFMKSIAGQIGKHLAPPLDRFHLGETRWFCQVYFGRDRRIHYEVSRPWSRSGRQLEIGLHFESRDKARNRALVAAFDRCLMEIQIALEREVKAEIWDKGWAKVYEIHPDTDLTESLAAQTTRRLAEFIAVLQPIYQSIERDD